MNAKQAPQAPGTNEFGQIIGPEVSNWQNPPHVGEAELTQHLVGQYCQLVPLRKEDDYALMAAFDQAADSLWTYLPYGPFKGVRSYQKWIRSLLRQSATLFAYTIQTPEGQVLGLCAYARIDPSAGSIEIAHLCFSPLLQQTCAATEAIYMMIDAAFHLGYRRCEWKCNSLNLPSVAAAGRFGFRYEGTFRQAQVVKGHNRDTDWFSILDHEWPLIKPCYENWLDKKNFDAKGKQRARLSVLTHKAIERSKADSA
ncbi:MAG: GNAT family protein [Oleiphilaceae bacterium]|nr:GNAT family protein [Oleiphilaceae bacterium]